MQTRVEKDTFGPIEVSADRLWGAQTQRSLHHFKISGERMPRALRDGSSHRFAAASLWSAIQQLAKETRLLQRLLDLRTVQHFGVVVVRGEA